MTVGDGVWAVVGDEPRVSFRSEVRAPRLPLCPCSVSVSVSHPRSLGGKSHGDVPEPPPGASLS